MDRARRGQGGADPVMEDESVIRPISRSSAQATQALIAPTGSASAVMAAIRVVAVKSPGVWRGGGVGAVGRGQPSRARPGRLVYAQSSACRRLTCARHRGGPISSWTHT